MLEGVQCSVASHTETGASLARIWEDNLGAGASGLSKPNRIILVAALDPFERHVSRKMIMSKLNVTSIYIHILRQQNTKLPKIITLALANTLYKRRNKMGGGGPKKCYQSLS